MQQKNFIQKPYATILIYLFIYLQFISDGVRADYKDLNGRGISD